MNQKSDWPLEAERDLLADACVHGRHPHSLWNFVRFAAGWHYRCLAREKAGLGPYWLTDEHRKFCDWLQERIDAWFKMRASGIQERFQLLVWVFRGFGKTNLFTLNLPAYIMLTERDLSSYIGSETHPKAKDFLATIKPMFDGSDPYPLFTWFYGSWYHPDRTWTTDAIVTSWRESSLKEPSIGTFGVETGIAGKHPSLMLLDDPIDWVKVAEGSTTAVDNAIQCMDAAYPALNNDSLSILIGTRGLERDAIGHVLEQEGVRSWSGHPPIENFRQGGKWDVYFLQARDVMDTKEYPKGRPMLPKSHSDQSLIDYENRNAKDYAVQMMGDPGTGEHMELTREQIQKLLIDRSEIPAIEYATIHLDTAFKLDERKARGDRNAIVVWLHDVRPTGMVFLDRIECSPRWRSEEFDQHVIRVLVDLKSRGIRVRAITDEAEVGGKRGVYKRHLEDVISAAGLRIPEIVLFNRGKTLKIVRLREAANYWLEGLARLVRDVPNLNILTEEMVKMGFSNFDDVADAAADVWRPEIWRGRLNYVPDEQPYLPYQPGDDILKGRIQKDLEDIEYELRYGRRKERSDFQPFDDLMEQRAREPIERW